MQSGEFIISFLERAAINLADNEKVSLWSAKRPGTIRFQKDAIQVDGKWKVSTIGCLLGTGILCEGFLMRFFLKDRTETISAQNLERVVIYRKKSNVIFHLFQNRDQGMVEVHVFVTNNNAVPQLLDSLKVLLPTNRFQEEIATGTRHPSQ